MNVGDKVRWTNVPFHDEGDEGVIVAIVPSGVKPCRRTPVESGGRPVLADRFRDLPYNESRMLGRRGRDHDSPMVVIGKHLYWPPDDELVLVGDRQ